MDIKTDQEFAVSGSFQFDYVSNFKNKINIDLGGIQEYDISKKNQKKQQIWLIDKKAISFEVKNNELLLTLDIYDTEGNIIADVKDNNWRINKNLVSKFNFDNKGFEVFDNKGRIALNVNIVPADNTVYIQGIFVGYPNHIVLFTSETMVSITDKNSNALDQDIAEALLRMPIKQLFEYNGKRWHGIRKTN